MDHPNVHIENFPRYYENYKENLESHWFLLGLPFQNTNIVISNHISIN